MTTWPYYMKSRLTLLIHAVLCGNPESDRLSKSPNLECAPKLTFCLSNIHPFPFLNNYLINNWWWFLFGCTPPQDLLMWRNVWSISTLTKKQKNRWTFVSLNTCSTTPRSRNRSAMRNTSLMMQRCSGQHTAGESTNHTNSQNKELRTQPFRKPNSRPAISTAPSTTGSSSNVGWMIWKDSIGEKGTTPSPSKSVLNTNKNIFCWYISAL